MKKIWIFSVLAIAVFAAVAVSGCVDSNNDNISGDWFFANDTDGGWLYFDSDGNGMLMKYVVNGIGEYEVVSSSGFVWTSDGTSAYLLNFADGTEKTVVPDMIRRAVTLDGVMYVQEPSEVSGYKLYELTEKEYEEMRSKIPFPTLFYH